MKVEVPLGDVVDKVTILDIKLRKLTAESALGNVRRERQALLGAWEQAGWPAMDGLSQWEQLGAVNSELWEVEDLLREHEARGDFGIAFVELARSVYRLNDTRAALKRAINDDLGSTYVEEKSYAEWKSSVEGGS